MNQDKTMYESFYGFTALPFSLLPDEGFLFLSRRHRRAINLLEYGIMSQAGFIVITGDVGAGKTTVIRRFLKQANPELTVGVITNPSKNLGKLMSWIAQTFELDDARGDEAKAYDHFVKFLVSQYAVKRRVVLIIDEAQNLSADMLEELRMLSNVSNGNEQLLQIVLVGQPELLETLKRNELRQLTQRISVHCYLAPLAPAETAAYIRHRLSLVGGSPHMFNDEACAIVYYFSEGVPRLINLLCDQALVYGFSEDQRHIAPSLIMEVVADRALSKLSAFKEVPGHWDVKTLDTHLRQIVAEINAEPVQEI